MIARQRLLSEKGQSILEFTIITPILLLIVLGVVEVSYAMLDQQIANRFTREGSNLISRSISIEDATNALRGMGARPINLNDGSSKVIFSVVKRGATTGTANYDRLFMYQRRVYGSFAGSSKIGFGGGSFNGAPDYEAVNADTNAALRTTNVSNDLAPNVGDMLYITEVYTSHNLLTPYANFGLPIPGTLYSIAYF